MSNLEPIDDKDLDLKNKFGSEKKVEEKPVSSQEPKAEAVPAPEKKVEMRREGAAEKEATYTKILSKVKTTQPADINTIAQDAKSTSQEISIESKIQRLVNLAQEKGVIHAVKVARHLEDNYVLDEMHSRLLSQELHDALVKKGFLNDL